MASAVPISAWPTNAPIQEPSPRWFRLGVSRPAWRFWYPASVNREVMTVSAAKKKVAVANPKVDMYETLIATIPGLERKGDANPYTAINGNMFTLLHQSSRLAIRLPEDKREEFLKKYKAKLFEAYGAVMREYVAVPDAMLASTNELKKYLIASYEYAKSLRPKATKKS